MFRARLFLSLALGLLGSFLLGLIQTATMKNTVASAYAAAATHAALYSTAPGASQGTELNGGSPAYARKALSWGSPSNGVIAASPVVFDVPSGATVAGGGVHSTATPGAGYLDGAALTSQPFSSQGTYTLTITFTAT